MGKRKITSAKPVWNTVRLSKQEGSEGRGNLGRKGEEEGRGNSRAEGEKIEDRTGHPPHMCRLENEIVQT